MIPNSISTENLREQSEYNNLYKELNQHLGNNNLVEVNEICTKIVVESFPNLVEYYRNFDPLNLTKYKLDYKEIVLVVMGIYQAGFTYCQIAGLDYKANPEETNKELYRFIMAVIIGKAHNKESLAVLILALGSVVKIYDEHPEFKISR